MSGESSGQDLVIWDSDDEPGENGAVVYRWTGHHESGRVRSLWRYVEAHAEELRARYLAWIHDLGVTPVAAGQSMRLVDWLRRDDGFSYWWMTTLVEQSTLKSPGIVDAIRMLAVEAIIGESQPRSVRLVGGTRSIHITLRDLCGQLSIPYSRTGRRHRREAFTLRRMYRALPPVVHAVVTVAREPMKRWPLRQVAPRRPSSREQPVCLISYFFNIDAALAKNGVFRSSYWGELPELLRDSGHSINWLHHYIEGGSVPNAAVAVDWTNRFNANAEREGSHAFLDSYLSWPVIGRVVVGWVRLVSLSVRLRGVRDSFRPAGSRLSLWPILAEDWTDSMRGPTAVLNLMALELFDEAFGGMPKQPLGIFLRENQGWERAMLYMWRKHGHGRTIAVAHSTIRHWDLRYFTDPRTLRDTSETRIPNADVMTVNGRAQLEAYRGVENPGIAIAECEALRYSAFQGALNSGSNGRQGAGRILVLGDYVRESTMKLMSMLVDAASKVPKDMSFAVKAHPGCPVDLKAYPSVTFTSVSGPLDRVLGDFDIAVSSHATSAAVDAYLAGVPVIVTLDEGEFNLSPLRGQAGVTFVATPEELAVALRATASTPATHSAKDFFFLDPALPRWRRLLGMTQETR